MGHAGSGFVRRTRQAGRIQQTVWTAKGRKCKTVGSTSTCMSRDYDMVNGNHILAGEYTSEIPILLIYMD